MYSFSNNNNNNITNPIRNIPVYSFLYANTNVSSSPRKIMPKNLDTTLSSQSLQRNKWETNHKLNSDNLSSVYSLNSNGKNGNSGITLNNINTYDYNSSNNNKSNNSNFNELEHSTQKINSSEEISLSVNRRTQPGISAVIRSLAQNLKPNININGEDNTMADSNGSKTNTNDSYKVSDNNKHTEENKPETFSYFPTNSYSFPSHTGLPSVVSSLSRGIDNSWKNKRYSYTANHNTHSNGNYLNDNDVNNNSTLMRPNDENIKMNTTKPVQTTQCDSPLLTNSSVYDGNEFYPTSGIHNNYYMNNTSNNNHNKYSPTLSPTTNYNALVKRSSSTSPYRPLLNYRPMWSVASNQNLSSNDGQIHYDNRNGYNEGIPPRSKYVDSMSCHNPYRTGVSGIGTGTQTSAPIATMTTTTTRGVDAGGGIREQSMLLTGNANIHSANNINRHMSRNENFLARPSISPRPDTNESNGELVLEQQQQQRKQQEDQQSYSKTYYVARRPQVMQSVFQKYRSPARYREHRLSYDPNTTIPTIFAIDKDIDYTGSLQATNGIHRKPIKASDISKYSSNHLSSGPLNLHLRNSLSLSALPTDEDSLSSLIKSQYPKDDYRLRVTGNAYSSNDYSNNNNNDKNYYPDYSHLTYPNHQSPYNAYQNHVQSVGLEQPQQTKLQTQGLNFHCSGLQPYNSESFRSFSVSPETGRKFTVGSMLIPCRSYNENINTLASNATLPSCLSVSSPVKRKACQVSFNLDRNMYVEYPYSESSTSLVQCKRVPGYISSSGAAPGETDLHTRTTPKAPFNWSNENGVTTIGKPMISYHSEYAKQVNSLASDCAARPFRSKYHRYASPPPQSNSNYDADNNINYNPTMNTSNQSTLTDSSSVKNDYASSKPVIRLIDTNIGQTPNFSSSNMSNININKPPVSGKSMNVLKSILSKPTFRYGKNTTNNLTSSKAVYKQIEQQENSVDARQSPAIDILNRRYSFSS